MAYIDPELIADEVAVAEGNLAALADIIPNWLASEGHVETSLAEAFGISEATIVALILDTERNNYAGFGERVVGVVRRAATAATSQITIVAGDDLGHDIPAGYEATFLIPDGTTVTVITSQAASIAAGQTSVLHVPVVALEPGPAGNGASGLDVDREDLAFVASVTLEEATAGGEDEEPLEDYVNRVVRRNRRGRVPASPDDYADFATDVDGVFAAIALNRHDPADPLADSLGHVTVYGRTAGGDPIGTDLKAEVEAYLNGIPRVMAAQVHADDPPLINIDATLSVVAASGVTETTARTAVVAAINAYLNKATFGIDPDSLGGWSSKSTQITIFDVSAAVDDLTELSAVVDVKLNGHPDPIPIPRTALVSAGSVTVVVATS